MDPSAHSDSAPPPPAGIVELTILPDGTIYARNLTPAIARILHALNPGDDAMRRRSGRLTPEALANPLGGTA